MRRALRPPIYLPRDKMYQMTGLLGIVGVITIAYGFAYRTPGSALFAYFEIWSWVFFLCLIGIAGGILLSRTETMPSIALPAWVTTATTAATLLSSCYFWLPTRLAALAGVAIIAACIGLHWSRRDRLCLPFLLLSGFALGCFLVATIPIDRNSADMLPLMADANRFLLSGQDPYAQQYSNLFYYLPMQWLIYLPTVVAGVDLRLTNLASFAIVGCLGLRLVRTRRLDEVVLLGLGPVILSRSSLEMIARGQVWPFWALLVGFAASLLSPRIIWPAVLLGVLLATQQPVAVIAILLGVWLVVHRGIFSGFLVIVVATCVFATIMAPWLVLKPTLLNDLYIGIQKAIAQSHLTAARADLVEVSILHLLQSLGLQSVRPVLLGIAIAGGSLFLAIRRNIGLGTLICTMGLVYLVSISLNVQIFKHYYYPGLLLLAIGIGTPRNLVGIGSARALLRDGAQVEPTVLR